MTRLDLSLPEAPRKRTERSILAFLTFLASLASVGLLAVLVGRDRDIATSSPAAAASERAEHLAALARDLERRTLYEQAAGAWGEHAAAAGLGGEKLAEVLYRRGVCLQKAGRPGDAARLYTEIELIDPSRDLKRKAQQGILECLSSLGKEEAREYVLRQTTIPDSEEKSPVVARVGGEEITLEDVRDELVRQLEARVTALEPAADPDELARRVQEMARERLQDRELVLTLLRDLVVRRVLYQEALSLGYGSGEEFERAASRFRQAYLAEKLVDGQRREVLHTITPTDLQNHYEANKGDYIEREGVEFSYLEFASEAEAKEAVAALAAGGDAAAALEGKLARAEGRAVSGEPLPGLGRSAEAVAQLLALEDGRYGERPVRIGGSWYVLRAERTHPSRQKTFDEARAEVRADLAARKLEETMRKLQERLEGKFRVEVLAGALEDAARSAAPPEGGTDAGEGDEAHAPK